MSESGSGTNDEQPELEPASPARICKEQMELEMRQSEPMVDEHDTEQKVTDLNQSGPLVNASTKAQAYLARNKQEMIDNIRAKFADSLATYDAIRSFIGRANLAPSLFSDSFNSAYVLGDFFSNGDGRMAQCELRCDFSTKANISFSFNPDTWTCSCCSEGHRILDRLNAAPSRSASRRVFWIGDQACPPTLMDNDSTRCIPVIRQEDATIKDLVKLFLHTVRGYRLQPGSVVIVSSATHMAAGGISHYLDQLVQATEWLNNFTRGEVELVPGPPLLFEGCSSRQVIRTIVELAAWLAESTGPVNSLADTFGETVRTLRNCSGGQMAALEPAYYILPTFLNSGPPEKVWHSGPGILLPDKIGALSSENEQTILDSFVGEINSKRGFDLPPLKVNRRPEPRQGAAGSISCVTSILVIGASHAERLAAELQ